MGKMDEIRAHFDENRSKFDFIMKADIGELVAMPEELVNQLDNELCANVGEKIQKVELILNESYQASRETSKKIYK